MLAAEGEDRDTVRDAFRAPQPMKIAEQRRYMVVGLLPRRVNQSRGHVLHRLKSTELAGQTRKSRAAIVQPSQENGDDERL